MGLSNGLNGITSAKYTFEDAANGPGNKAPKDFGMNAVEAYLHLTQYSSKEERQKDPVFQERLLANSVGYGSYQEMGDALASGRLSTRDVQKSFKELLKQGLVNEDHFLPEETRKLKERIAKSKEAISPQTQQASEDYFKNYLSSYFNIGSSNEISYDVEELGAHEVTAFLRDELSSSNVGEDLSASITNESGKITFDQFPDRIINRF